MIVALIGPAIVEQVDEDWYYIRRADDPEDPFGLAFPTLDRARGYAHILYPDSVEL